MHYNVISFSSKIKIRVNPKQFSFLPFKINTTIASHMATLSYHVLLDYTSGKETYDLWKKGSQINTVSYNKTFLRISPFLKINQINIQEMKLALQVTIASIRFFHLSNILFKQFKNLKNLKLEILMTKVITLRDKTSQDYLRCPKQAKKST